MIVGFNGKAGSGKDTAAQALIDLGWFKYSFAQPIRDGLTAMFGISQADMFNQDIKNLPDYYQGKSIRYLLQSLGTEWGRRFISENVWIDRTMQICSQHENVVLADVRYDNEAQAIIDAGGIVIQVVRLNNEHINLTLKNGIASHETEKGISDYLINFTIENNASKQELMNAVIDVVIKQKK